MSDRFREVTGKLAKLGIARIPVGGLLAQVASAFLPPNAEETLKEAVEADLQEIIDGLDAKIETLAAKLQAQGQKLDELSTIRTVGLAREVAQATTEARSPEKSEAILNAAARQFDSTAGSAAVRAHWFAEVRRLSDVEAMAIQLLAKHWGLMLKEGGVRAVPVGRQPSSLLELSADERFVLEATLASLTERKLVRHGSIGGAGQSKGYRLTKQGEVLAKYVAAD